MQSEGWSSRRGAGSWSSPLGLVLNEVPDPEPDGSQGPSVSLLHWRTEAPDLASSSTSAFNSVSPEQLNRPALRSCSVPGTILGSGIQTSDPVFLRTLQVEESCSETQFPHLYNERVCLRGFRSGPAWNPRIPARGSE